jgi:ABC-type transport system substrate-binding protein
MTGLEDLLETGNKERAQSLLLEAKIECPQIHKRATTKDLGLRMLVWDSDVAIAQAESVSKAANKVGIQISLKVVSAGSYYAYLRNPNKRGDLFMLVMTPEWLHPASLAREFLLPGGFRQFMGSGNSEEFKSFIDSFNQVLQIESDEEQRDAWVAINQQLMDKTILLPLFQYRTQFFWGSNVTSVGVWSAFSVPVFNDLGLKVVASDIE